MFNVVRHFPQIGCEFEGGGYAGGQIRSTPVQQPRIDFASLSQKYPGFNEEWNKHSRLESAERIAETIRALLTKQAPKEQQYVYIEKTDPNGFYTSAQQDDVVFVPDGNAILANVKNGETYVYKVPGHTITCEGSQGKLRVKIVTIDSTTGGENRQLYIPVESPLAKLLRVRKLVQTEVPTCKLPPQPPRVHMS